MKWQWMLIALVSGTFLPIQAGLNTKLGKTIDSPVYASLISFAMGVVSLSLFAILTKQSVVWDGLKSAPLYVWVGGILGAFYVTAIILSFPKIGPAVTFGLVIAGQMIITILLDHFNILVAQQHSINIWRVVGVILIVGGVVLIRKF